MLELTEHSRIDEFAALAEPLGERMLGGLANRIDGWVLAEGIEREEELLELMRLEVPLAQGYLLGRPDPQLTTHLPATGR